MGVVTAGLRHLVTTASWLQAKWSSTPQLYPARFSRLYELSPLRSDTWQDEAALLLCRSAFNQPLLVRPTPKRRELGNLLICAPPRSGKSQLATAQLLTWPHSAIVNDLKGDLYAATAGYRQTLGKVFVIDFEGFGHRFDPLSGKESEDALFAVAAHLLHVPDEGPNAVFTQHEEVMLTQIWLASRSAGLPPFAFTRQCLSEGLQATAALLYAISPDLARRFLASAFEEANFDSRFLVCCWQGLAAKLYPFLTELVVRCLAGADFHAADLMTAPKPVTVYLRFTERYLFAQAPLIRLLFGTLIDDLTATYDTAVKQGREISCRPVLVIADEAGRTAIPSLVDQSATVNGRGISLWIAVQSLSQLEAVYTKPRAHILRDNMRTQLFFPPDDLQTAKYLEERLGDRSAYARSHTTRDSGTGSQGLSEHAVPVLSAWQIQYTLDDEQIIGFHGRRPPFQGRRLMPSHFPILAQRAGLPAPPVAPLPPLPPIDPQRLPAAAPTAEDEDPINPGDFE